MKKIILFLALIVSVSACTDDFEELNVDPKSASSVPAVTLFSSAQKSLVDQMSSPGHVFRLYAQHWANTTYYTASQYDLVTSDVSSSFWAVLYRDVLADMEESKRLINADNSYTDQAVKQNQLAVIEIMEVYTWGVLTDIFGDVPYSKALDIDNPSSAYDDDAIIYADLITRLDAALTALDASAGSFDKADLLYNGSVTQWRKFGNSLKLKLGMILIDVDATKAERLVEEAAAAGVFTSNSDNAALQYASATPNTNPVWVNLVQSGRQDYVPANTIVDKMNELADPRRSLYFTTINGQYVGGIYGTSNNYDNYSHIGDIFHQPDLEGLILDYSEVEFYLAEAVERGFNVSGTAVEHYTKAITASMQYWGVTQNEIDAYLAKPSVAYTTAEGDYLQKIGVQKWIALYNRGYEAWTEWRRIDYPKLAVPAAARLSAIPVRYPYPINEQTLNMTNWTAAATAIGGDKPATHVFWDVK